MNNNLTEGSICAPIPLTVSLQEFIFASADIFVEGENPIFPLYIISHPLC